MIHNLHLQHINALQYAVTSALCCITEQCINYQHVAFWLSRSKVLQRMCRISSTNAIQNMAVH